MAFGWPVILIFHYLGEEEFGLPSEKYVWLWLVTVAVGKVFASLLWIW